MSACSHQRQGCSCHKNHTGLKRLLFVSEQTRIVACLGRVLLEAWKEPVKGAIDLTALLPWAPQYNTKSVSKASSVWVQAVLFRDSPELSGT